MPKGSIEKRGEMSYRIRIYLGTDENGKQKYYTETVRGTEDEAEARLAELIVQYYHHKLPKDRNMKVTDFIRLWLTTIVDVVCRPTTRELVRGHMEWYVLPHIGHVRLVDVSPMRIQTLYSILAERGRKNGRGGLSPNTINTIHGYLSWAFNTAVQWGYLSENVVARAKPPSSRRRKSAWTKGEAHKFLEAAQKSRYYPIYALAILTGMRRGELLGLKWEDVDWDNKRVHVRRAIVVVKGKRTEGEVKTESSQRKVALSEKALEILREHRRRQDHEKEKLGGRFKDEGWVFCTWLGRPLHPENVSTMFRRMCQQAGVRRIPFHALRHTYASHLLLAGVPLTVVQEQLGHAHGSTTVDEYAEFLPGAERQAVGTIDALMPGTMPGREAGGEAMTNPDPNQESGAGSGHGKTGS